MQIQWLEDTADRSTTRWTQSNDNEGENYEEWRLIYNYRGKDELGGMQIDVSILSASNNALKDTPG